MGRKYSVSNTTHLCGPSIRNTEIENEVLMTTFPGNKWREWYSWGCLPWKGARGGYGGRGESGGPGYPNGGAGGNGGNGGRWWQWYPRHTQKEKDNCISRVSQKNNSIF